jgi:CBS domain-containing protein
VLERASSNTIFLAMMCENALLHSPPLGFFKTFVLESDGDHNNTLNLKHRGTIPIVDIARNYALAGGLRSLNTIERLQDIAAAGDMSREMAYSLIDAHEFIAGIRLEAQGKQYRAGNTPDNHLDPRELSPLMRHQIKDAFHIVRDAQNAMKVRFGGGVL